MKKMFPIFFIILLSCLNQANDKTKAQANSHGTINDTLYVWTKLSDSAPWSKSYNFQMFSIKDSLWTFHSDGNWFSINGVDWTKSPLPNSIYNLAFLDYVQF